MSGGRSRVERWERTSEVPLLLLAVAFLVAYAWPILDPGLDHDLGDVLGVASWTIWVAFAFDFLIRLWLAEDTAHYAVRHWYDVVLIAAPVFRPLRLLRLLAFARILNRSAVGNLAGRVSVYVAGVAVAATGLGALAVLDAERDAPGATITTSGDALWWALTTVTTVGYGDFYPVTTTGRLVAAALMIVGIGVVGSVTAVVAAWLVESVNGSSRRDRND
ncbi:potassium channel family protein [Nocardioides mangrovi]|uniref:Potassium channel family protein n=1 Tax=Nocardioides mangrovi TaxID=2874580 RepID=A0ABS7U982_9ACTN|nr:potassium channel family protein [Nocardioides mangrovi]MBZ5737286.1 potassium channel family protein [Nocardioides mangrovi]